jgi:hypothetical protein
VTVVDDAALDDEMLMTLEERVGRVCFCLATPGSCLTVPLAMFEVSDGEGVVLFERGDRREVDLIKSQ